MVPAVNFQAALRDSLKDVTLKANKFAAAISEAWETFKSKKWEESYKCEVMIFHP